MDLIHQTSKTGALIMKTFVGLLVLSIFIQLALGKAVDNDNEEDVALDEIEKRSAGEVEHEWTDLETHTDLEEESPKVQKRSEEEWTDLETHTDLEDESPKIEKRSEEDEEIIEGLEDDEEEITE